MKNTLTLRIKKKWFDLIEKGEKIEEYRKISPYYISRIENKTIDKVLLINGYSRNSPQLLFECKGIIKGFGNPNWGADNQKCYIIKIGRIYPL